MSEKAERAALPSEYGLKADSRVLPWSHVDERMAAAKHYWVATVGTDGSPCVRPVDAVWLDGRLYFGGADGAKWRRNVERDPRVSVHLELGQYEAVILEGRVNVIRPGRALAEPLARASDEKYGYGQQAEDYEKTDMLEFRPHTAFAWTLLFEDATRWTFDD